MDQSFEIVFLKFPANFILIQGKNTKSARKFRERRKNEEMINGGDVGCEFIVNDSMTSLPRLFGIVHTPDIHSAKPIPLHSSLGNEVIAIWL